MDFTRTQILLMAIEQLERPVTFLRDRYFPTNEATDIFNTDDVLVEYREGSKKLAPFVAPRKGGVTILREGYNMERFTPPFIAPRRSLTIDDLNKRGFGEALYSTLTPAQRQNALLLKDADELSDMISRREEAMAAEVLQNNSCIMKHIADDADKGDDLYIQFYDGDVNPAQYAPANPWTADYEYIIDDIAVMIRMLVSRGLPAEELLVAPDVGDAILSNKTIQKLLDIKNYDIGRVNPEQLPDGVSRIARLNVRGRMIDVLCYEESYTDDNGVDKPFILPGNAIMTAPAIGRTLYGAVTQLEQIDGQFHTYAGRRVPKYLSNADNNTRSLTVTSCPLPIVNNKNPFVKAKVLF